MDSAGRRLTQAESLRPPGLPEPSQTISTAARAPGAAGLWPTFEEFEQGREEEKVEDGRREQTADDDDGRVS